MQDVNPAPRPPRQFDDLGDREVLGAARPRRQEVGVVVALGEGARSIACASSACTIIIAPNDAISFNASSSPSGSSGGNSSTPSAAGST